MFKIDKYRNSDWDIGNVTNMGSIFGGCRSLISLPDISR